MFEDLELVKQKVEIYLNIIEEYIEALNNKGVRLPYLNAMEKVKKEFNLFNNNIENTLNNFIKDISPIRSYDPSGNQKTVIITPDLDSSDIDLIQKYNLNLKERLNRLDLNYVANIVFEDDVGFYNIIYESLNDVSRLRLDFLKFYKEIRNKKKSSSENMIKHENDFYNYINEKSKEIDIKFISFENKIKSVVSKYNIANDDLKDLNKSYLDVSEKVKGVYSQLADINSNVFNLSSELNKRINDFELELTLKADKVQSTIYDKTIDVVHSFATELDETEALIKNEIESIKKTSKSFKDFISDETAIKLTDDYKNKAKWEMIAYYLFNFISLIIIGFAIYFSYSSLSDFATKHTGDYTSLDLVYLGIRLIFSILIFSTIAFTSRLASKSYIYWKKNEGIFLRLTALKSFIADMSESKKEEIHEKLVDVYFGKDEQDQNLNQKLRDLPDNITQLLGKVVDQTSGVIDSARGNKNSSSSEPDK